MIFSDRTIFRQGLPSPGYTTMSIQMNRPLTTKETHRVTYVVPTAKVVSTEYEGPTANAASTANAAPVPTAYAVPKLGSPTKFWHA